MPSGDVSSGGRGSRPHSVVVASSGRSRVVAVAESGGFC